MRKTLALFLLLFAASSSALHAAEIEPSGTPLRKLQRGFLNIVLSPLEISSEMDKEKTRDTMPPSWVLGWARGMFFMVGRIVTGAYELVTFLIPLPAEYAPILEPEFPYQHLQNAASEEVKS